MLENVLFFISIRKIAMRARCCHHSSDFRLKFHFIT